MEPESACERAPSLRSLAVTGAIRFGARPFVHHVPGYAIGIRTARSTMDLAARLMPPTLGVRVRSVDEPEAGGRPAIHGEWIIARHAGKNGRPPAGAVLYLHGGGYVVCSPRTHRPITCRLAQGTGLPVFAPRYRLAPEHPFPAALEDALAAYHWLMDQGIPADGIVIAGDSAGGHLAASLTGEICRTGLPRPAGTVLYSPWVDLTCELASRAQRLARDPYISPHSARRVARLVVGQADADDPRLALLNCSWTDTPPFLIQVGGAEVLKSEAEALAEALDAAGCDCRLQVWKGQMHVFQMFHRVLPEASAAMDETSAFVRSLVRGARDAESEAA
ncbi:alpha/beta hydrolase [Actinomadura sp. SCN-SB]|uniref:alpha/beta hydrolase n=1 Tax=Actinomadura sp. SCN-SB TaxID=3373092 RepID=UPI0037517357